MFKVVQQVAVIRLTHTFAHSEWAEWDIEQKLSCAAVRRRNTKRDERVRETGQVLSLSITAERSLSLSPWVSQHSGDHSNPRVKQGTLSQDSTTRASPPLVPILPSKPPALHSLPCLWKQGWISKSPGCFGGGEEPDIIWPLSLTQLLPALSQLKVKGCKSVAGFYNLVFLGTARSVPHRGPWDVWCAWILSQHTKTTVWLKHRPEFQAQRGLCATYF